MDMRKTVLSLAGSVAVVAFMAVTANGAEESQAVLKKQIKVSEAQARSTALARVVNGTVKSSELEKENGRLIWSFDIATPKTQNITEVQVDAKTGKIVSTHIETPAKQAKEAQSEN
jgi:uncharacterized membrane protein YkoI